MTLWEVAESWVKYVDLDACKVFEPLSRILATAVLSERRRTKGSLLLGIILFITLLNLFLQSDIWYLRRELL
jgi:hypothetical protein